ncbi:cadherin-related family member 5-like [Cottoperca gobio]|uniref:Cadherin-related family member 5-like n=1 Tax=Cottoperca gobio TaxID=56716 RepID=A0A6J2PV31_COTGO|nr:cadherin-related family member 5-like [Cottoperca gobio]
MDGIHPHFIMRTSFSFILLTLLQTSSANICSAVSPWPFRENNTVGDVVLVITVQPEVTLKFRDPPANPTNPFSLNGNKLIAEKVLDYELELIIIVTLENVNDNVPVFDQNSYQVEVNELSPANTIVGRFAATDLDGDNLYYTLTPESRGFGLKSPTNPDLIIVESLDYDKVKNVQLILTVQVLIGRLWLSRLSVSCSSCPHVKVFLSNTLNPPELLLMDTALAPAHSRVSFTATTTIMITILDVDNRPPWFQPCSKQEIGGAVICQSAGYTSKVVLNEQEPGVLPLKPGPLYAIDGDSGINEETTYSFLSGDGGGLFGINPNTGNITMLKPVDLLGTISLTVLAAQKMNIYQFSTTSVTISVQVKSLHPPKFQRPQYEGVIAAVGLMAMDPKNKDEPLRILATDDDYTATGGINPHITYYVHGSSDFSIISGYLFMTKDLPEATLSLQVVAMDSSTEESVTAQLSVEVTSGLTTTSLPESTTDSMASTSIGESTTNSKTTEDIASTPNPTTSTDSSLSTTFPGTTNESIVSTTDPSLTSEGSVSTGSTAHPPTVIVPSGGYGPVDMAALGVTLGALLFICLVVIVVLAVRIRRGKADWRKIYEASMFQSALGQGGQKEGIQYTNEAFQDDEDGGSTGSGGPVGGSIMAGDFRLNEAIVKSSAPLHILPRDDNSQAGSDNDNEKEVKPILTKERRMDEGYKSVWFKEDIDPNAKEEVVIIPDSREEDSEEEDEEQSSSGREEDEDDNTRRKTLKVIFNDADLDSGLGVKMEDPDEDSEGDEVLTDL